MTPAQASTLGAFLRALANVPWFTRCGEPEASAMLASDLAEAWDVWHSPTVWSIQTHALESVAVAALGEAGVDAVFARVSEATEEPQRAAMEVYFNRRPVCSA